jgi:hypothetical protein
MKSVNWIIASLGIVILLLVANHGLVTGRETATMDAALFFCPEYMLIADFANKGEFLLWNPWINGGAPDGIEPQVGAFSPFVLLIARIAGATEAGFRIYWLTVWALAGIGVLFFSRHLKISAWVGFIGAVSYIFSANFVNQGQLTAFLVSLAFFPWILWRFHVALTDSSRFAAIQSGCLWGLCALSSYPGLMILISLYLTLWGIIWSVTNVMNGSDKETSSTALRFRWFITVLCFQGIFSAVVSSPALVGFMVEGNGYSDRSGPLAKSIAVDSNAFNPGALATFFSPQVVEKKFDNLDLWPETDVTLASIYMFPPILMCGLLLPFIRRDRFYIGLSLIALLFLLTSFGSHTPIRGLLYDFFPPLRYFRHAAIFRCFSIFSFIILGMLALKDWELRSSKDNQRMLKYLGFLCVVAILVGIAGIFLINSLIQNDSPFRNLAKLHVICVWGGMVLFALIGLRWHTDSTFSVQKQLMLLLLILDCFLVVKLNRRYLYCPNRDNYIAELSQNRSDDIELTQGLYRDREPSSRLNSHLGSKVPMLFGYTAMTNWFHEKYRDYAILANSAISSNRIWFSTSPTQIDWTRSEFEKFAEISEALGTPGFVLKPSVDSTETTEKQSLLSGNVKLARAKQIEVQVQTYNPRELVFDVIAPSDGWILVTDRWSKGWTCNVNGQTVNIYIGNFIFRAIKVNSGSNHVQFEYRPFGFPWLLGLSWSALVVVSFVTLARTMNDGVKKSRVEI